MPLPHSLTARCKSTSPSPAPANEGTLDLTKIPASLNCHRASSAFSFSKREPLMGADTRAGCRLCGYRSCWPAIAKNLPGQQQTKIPWSSWLKLRFAMLDGGKPAASGPELPVSWPGSARNAKCARKVPIRDPTVLFRGKPTPKNHSGSNTKSPKGVHNLLTDPPTIKSNQSN